MILNSQNDAVTLIDSPLGRIAIYADAKGITAIDLRVKQTRVKTPVTTSVLQECKEVLQQYFVSAQTNFDIPLHLIGTPFQRRVWWALQQIPVGEVRTYGAIARQLKSSARAVGNACRANPIPIIVPCHRVVAASGLGGYSGKTGGQEIETKSYLLRHEGVKL